MAAKLGEFVAFILDVTRIKFILCATQTLVSAPVTVGDANLWCIRNTSQEGRLGTGLLPDIEDVLLAEFNRL